MEAGIEMLRGRGWLGVRVRDWVRRVEDEEGAVILVSKVWEAGEGCCG